MSRVDKPEDGKVCLSTETRVTEMCQVMTIQKMWISILSPDARRNLELKKSKCDPFKSDIRFFLVKDSSTPS